MSGPLIHHPPVRSWLKSIDEKLRSIYAAITCRRASDVAYHPAAHRPPRPRAPPAHRGEPRPRLIPQTTSRPPTPHQAGGSAWQRPPTPDQAGGSAWQRPPTPGQAGGSAWQHQTTFDYWQQSSGASYGLRPTAQPHGMFLLNNVQFVISSIIMFFACRRLRTPAAYFRRLVGE